MRGKVLIRKEHIYLSLKKKMEDLFTLFSELIDVIFTYLWILLLKSGFKFPQN